MRIFEIRKFGGTTLWALASDRTSYERRQRNDPVRSEMQVWLETGSSRGEPQERYEQKLWVPKRRVDRGPSHNPRWNSGSTMERRI